MKYLIVKRQKEHDLEQIIEYYLEQGWKLQGGIAITPNDEFCQAIVLDVKYGVKYDPNQR